MKTLFGIRSNIAVMVIGVVYLVISLRTSIYAIKYLYEFPSEKYAPRTHLLINTETTLFHAISSIFSVTCMLSSLLLILGAIEKRYAILRPWLIVNIVLECVFTSFFFYLINLFIEIHHTSWSNICGLLLAIFFTIMAVVFHNYLWNGTYALYRKLEKESKRLYRVIDHEDTAGVIVV